MVHPEELAGVADVDLSGRTALVTGATSGVGRETALALGRLGATVLVHGRDRDRGAAVADTIGHGAFLRADFTSQDAVRELADEVRDRVDSLDVLVSAAGAYFASGERTEDGIERTVAVNHVAPFLLTQLLRPHLSETPRVVVVASEVHRDAESDDLRRDRFTSTADFSGYRAYARSKLANVLFARELASRGVHVNSLHPGFVPGSGLWREAPLPIRAAVGTLAALPGVLTPGFAETQSRAARTPVYLAAGPVERTGRYFADCEEDEPSPAGRDDDLAERLWATSEGLVGLD